MATINKRKIRLNIEWNKNNPDDFIYWVVADGAIDDDSRDGGEDIVTARSDIQTITRTAFRALTGAQIETNAKTLATDALNALGSGAGGHTIVEDSGN